MIPHIISQTLKGKTVNRMLMHESLRKYSLAGDVLDVGAGTVRSTYFDFFRKRAEYSVTSVDISNQRKPDIVANLEQSLPVAAEAYDSVLCFNLLEHIYDHRRALAEIHRVLKPGGQLVGYVPFLVKYHPDPNDYFRYTQQGLARLFHDAGFTHSTVDFVGHGPFTAAWAQVEYIVPRLFRWAFTYVVFLLDAVLLKYKPVFKHVYPLGYTFIATK